MKRFEGVFTALITPFLKGRVDFSSLSRLVQNQLDNGVRGFVINGTTAESPTLNEIERKQIFDHVRNVTDSSVSLIFGTGTNSTEETIERSLQAQQWGADGILVVVPYYNKPPQSGLLQHYTKIAQRVSIPLMLYNVPGRTSVSLSTETIQELSRISNIVGIKEASGDVVFGENIVKACSSEFLVVSGDDFTFLDLALRGGRGVISVLSHVIPMETGQLLHRAMVGDRAVIKDFQKFKPLVEGLFIESNPIPVKAALKMRGLISSDELRLPLCAMSEKNKKDLEMTVKQLGLFNE